MKLYEPLPVTLTINGILYPINSDFRVMVLFSQNIVDGIMSQEKIFSSTLNYFYTDTESGKIKIPEQYAIQGLLTFYEGHRTGQKSGGADNERSYDYDYDSDIIVAAFKQQYSIDLTAVDYLHWWTFKAYFKSIDENTRFSRTIGYRTADTSKMPKEMQAFYARQKMLTALPKTKGEAQSEQEFLKKIRG